MLRTLIVFSIGFMWLMIETDCLRLCLPCGKIAPKVYLLPATKPILMLPSPMNIYEAHSMDEWDRYYKDYACQLEQQQTIRRIKEAEQKRLICPICKNQQEFYVKTRTFTIGNSTFTLTGCNDCIQKRVDEITKIQTQKHKPKEYMEAIYCVPAGKRFYEWSEEEYPHTIELEVNRQLFSINGNYKAGLISECMGKIKKSRQRKTAEAT